MVIAAMKLKNASSWKESYDQPRQHIEKQRYYFANKGPSSQDCGFSSNHVWMCGEGNDTPLQLLLPGKSYGWRSLVGCSPWGC